MTYSPILGMIQVATNQTQKENAINTQTTILEGAGNDNLAVTMTGNAVTLTPLQWTRYAVFILQSSTASATLTVPNSKRVCYILNQCANAVTVTTGSGATVSVAASTAATIMCDGSSNIYLLAAAT